MGTKLVSAKPCSQCHELLPAAAFYRNKYGSSGLTARCIACFKKSYKQRWEGKPLTEKACSLCKQIKPSEEFYNCATSRGGLQSHCKACNRFHYEPKSRETYRAYRLTWDGWKDQALRAARRRALRRGVPFSLLPSDLPTPTTCPILGIPLVRNKRGMSADSPTLDRVIPVLGYVPGNVVVISWLANTIKKDITDPTVFEKIAQYLRMHAAKTETGHE
jgi:hypothetical protein